MEEVPKEQISIHELQVLVEEYKVLSEELNALFRSMKDGESIRDRQDIRDIQSKLNAIWEKMYNN